MNIRQHPAYEVIEGVVETDWWFGPLFANIRLRKEGVPFTLSENHPFLQLLPFSKALNAEHSRSEPNVFSGLSTMTEKNWEDFTETIPNRIKDGQQIGDYAITSRRKKS